MIALLLAIEVTALGARPAPVRERIQFAQLSIRQRIVIRVQSILTPPEIIEKKGPQCLPLAAIGGAAITTPNGVDLILRGGQRVRARFSSRCPALDYYSGFYIVPNPDGQVCADRDVIRSRAGGECPIDRLRTLVVRPPKH